MGWETRRGRRFYYRTQRLPGGKFRKLYLGAGEVARQAAEKDAAAKAKREAERMELAQFEAKLSGVEQLATLAEHGVALLTEAALLSVGFHQHRGQWRRHRDGD